MKKILTIIGARPQFIKAAAVSHAIRKNFANLIEEDILHTGQHYDREMSEQFFEELDIPRPRFNLGVGSGSHAVQTAAMLTGIEEVLTANAYDGVLVYGDTNSTLAGALTAAKLHIPVYHVEAGLRSFNRAMPEEINRIVADHTASLLFAPTETAMKNLRNEGFDNKRIVMSGDVMLDIALSLGPAAREHNDILDKLGLRENNYILATVHRDFNTDNPERLTAIIKALQHIALETPVVLPLHPRTAKALSATGLDADGNGLKVIPPASLTEMLTLEQCSKMVITDSGGVQKEAFFFKRPCIILRPETEWTEITDHGAALLTDADPDKITEAYKHYSNSTAEFPNLFGDGHAAEHILKAISSYKF